MTAICISTKEKSAPWTLRVLERGRKPASPVTLRIVQRFNPEKAISGPIPPAARALEHPDVTTTDADGIARITVRAKAAMLGFLSCFVDGQADSPSPSSGCLINFRIFPAGNYDQLTDAEIDFDLIYREVLRYYHVIYPAMGRIFPLNDEQTLIDNADGIRERMKPELHDSWEYMPRTREMSSAKRNLLLRWLAKVAPANCVIQTKMNTQPINRKGAFRSLQMADDARTSAI